MQTFSEYKQLAELTAASVDIVTFINEMEQTDQITEAVLKDLPDINDVLGKIGLKVHKTRGLLSMLKSASKWVGRVLYYAVKASQGDEEARQLLKTTLKNHVTKEELMDFLLKLDNATLHLLSIPLHTIAAITGWELEANLQQLTNYTKIAGQKIEDTIKFLEDLKRRSKDEIKKKIDDIIMAIKKYITPPEKVVQP